MHRSGCCPKLAENVETYCVFFYTLTSTASLGACHSVAPLQARDWLWPGYVAALAPAANGAIVILFILLVEPDQPEARTERLEQQQPAASPTSAG